MKQDFATQDVTFGQANALLKKLMAMMGVDDPVEVVRRINSDEWTLVGPTQSTDSVDCDVAPFVPEGWTVVENRPCGQIKPEETDLYVSEGQEKGSVSGYELQKKLANLPVLNAVMLDWYLAHPELIPEDWKGKYVFFWGTIYRNSDGRLCVRCLHWDGSQWYWDCSWLGSDFDSSDPAVVASL